MACISYANGIYQTTEEVSIPVVADLTGTIRGYRIFTACRTVNGKIFQKEAHLERVFNSAQDIYMNVPCSKERLSTLLEEVLDKNNRASEEFLVEIVFSGGEADESKIVPIGNTLLYILIFPLKTPSEETLQKGIALATYPYQRPCANVKLMHYIGAVIAQKTVCKQFQADHPLFVTPGDTAWVLEGATSNIFCVKNNTLITPPVDDKILAGITRKVVIELAKKAQIPVKEDPILLDTLLAADEVFITSSLRNILPVYRINHTSTNPDRTLTRKLIQAFNEYLLAY